MRALQAYETELWDFFHPHSLKAVVALALGTVNYSVTEHEKASRVFRRSLYIIKDMKKGEIFSKKNIRSIRPGHGLPSKYLDIVLGKHAQRDLKKGTPLRWDDIIT
jgi:N-acetylneuraminate synthase